jgi:hypothetical protein
LKKCTALGDCGGANGRPQSHAHTRAAKERTDGVVSEMARSRGKKSKLPPRVRSNRWRPRLSHIDFASTEIVEALIAAGGTVPDAVGELDIHNEIRDIVGDYIMD